tara:strand:- start:575 stop:1276 length:702 start_codon:yes stop_codon:yes gene_type:complete
MRKRTLSDDGLNLFLNGMTTHTHTHWTKRLICNLFHSDYDDRLFDVVAKCRESTQGLCADFFAENMQDRLDSGVMHTIRLIITKDNKKVKKRDVEKNFRFFLDVMDNARKQNDNQTAHMMYLALTHPAIQHIDMKKPKRTYNVLSKIKYGAPTYRNHIKYWRSVRSDEILPSLIAFKIFIRRCEFSGKDHDAQEAKEMMEIFKYLDHRYSDILPIYNQKKMSTVQLLRLAKKL